MPLLCTRLLGSSVQLDTKAPKSEIFIVAKASVEEVLRTLGELGRVTVWRDMAEVRVMRVGRMVKGRCIFGWMEQGPRLLQDERVERVSEGCFEHEYVYLAATSLWTGVFVVFMYPGERTTSNSGLENCSTH